MDSPPCKCARISTDNEILFDYVLIKIIRNVPVAHWCRLELVSKQFQRCTQSAYRVLTSISLENIFFAEFGEYSKNQGRLQQFLAQVVSRCPRLNTISGFDCLSDKLTFRHLELLRNFTKLKQVNFETCTVKIGAFSRFLKNFPHLQELTICESQLESDSMGIDSDEDLDLKNAPYYDFFEKLRDLEELSLTNFYALSGNFLVMINAENLKLLNLSRTKFRDVYVVSLLNRCVNLETLYLYDPRNEHSTGLKLQVLQCLPNLSKLRKFSLDINGGEGVMEYTVNDLLNVLVGCVNLKDIRLHCETVEITDDFLRCLIAERPLENLNFRVRWRVSKEVMSKIANLQNLTSLSLENCRGNVLENLCSKLENLHKLSALTIGAQDVSEAELLSLKNLKTLTSFTYYGNHVTEQVLRSWVEAGFLKKLKTLKILCNINHTIVKSISENAPILEDFQFQGEAINDETLQLIAENCKRLKILDLDDCFGFSLRGLLKLLSFSSGLNCLIINNSFFYTVPRNALFKRYKNIIWIGTPHVFVSGGLP